MQVFQRIYEAIMLLLVMVTIMTLWLEHSSNPFINWVVWFIFFVDFCVRMFRSPNKWIFIKENPFLLIAIIPFDQFFQIARLVRIMYLFRMKTITKFYIHPIMMKISYHSKLLILMLVSVFLILESLIIQSLEENITTLSEAFYYVFLQLFFFGQHTIEVEKVISLTLFVSTAVIGVLLHGIALQWFFTKVNLYFQKYKKNKKNEKNENCSNISSG
ncbi:transporter [Alkalihalobacillus deserti]|uniref:transporter n=1 Tax=Alkalihalobacillus deserti TaxID=2879466 RepID=UPI001D14EA52|nr:transporter [Alkalihalobacillus deserti]